MSDSEIGGEPAIMTQKKFKNTKENNKSDGAGLFSTEAGETLSRALMRLRAMMAEDA